MSTATLANPLLSLAKADLALVLGVIVTAANNIKANPTGLNAVAQIAGLPTTIVQTVPAAETLNIASLADFIASLAAEKQAALTAA